MNRSSLIHWLLTAQAGSELNLIKMKLEQMINFKVRLGVFLFIGKPFDFDGFVIDNH